MILKRCLSVLFVVAATVLCTAAFSQAEIVVGDFETGLDGWTVNSAASISESTIGATSGSKSLLVQGVLPGAFQWAIQLNNNSLASVIEANPILKYDVTWVTSDWSADNGTWARVDTLAVNSDATGWKQTNDAMMTDPANPLYPGSWDPVNWGQQNTRTVAYDLSSLVGGASAASWFQLNLSINYDSAFDTDGGTYYLDNIRLAPIPEPSSIVLLGLGGMMAVMMPRRRRCAARR